jgi:hypothetical protein
MAHFAQLDENNIVTQVIVVSNQDTSTEDGVENENIGIQFCRSLFGENTNWKQTSYNAKFRYNYAGIGYTYDLQRDAFIPPKPYPSWILDEASCLWTAPTPMPTDGKLYTWDENTLAWTEEQNNLEYDIDE